MELRKSYIALKVIPDVPINVIFRWQVIDLLVLMGEAVIYWCIRKWTIRKLYIWLHIGAIYFILVALPVLFTIIAVNLFDVSKIDENTSAMVDNTRFIIYWSMVIIGHIFFAAAIINGIRNKNKQKDTEQTGLFDSI